MPNGEDHDRIIRVETKINTICASIQRIENIQEKLFDEIKQQKLLCEDKSIHDQDVCRACKRNLDEKIDKKVNWGKFIAIISLILGLFGGSIGWMNSIVLDNRDRVMSLTHIVEDHIKHAEDFYQKFHDSHPPHENNDADPN